MGHGDKIIYHKAFGKNISTATIFDLASLTKIFTALSIFILAQNGQIRLKAAVADYLPEFKQHGKESITVEQCLLHTSGLASNASQDTFKDSAGILEKLAAQKLANAPNEKFVYSDTGYIILGKIIEKISGMPLNNFIENKILVPLKMYSSGFCTKNSKHNTEENNAIEFAPTGYRDGKIISGQVHDERAFLMGGVAGHAGLFATSEDLFKFCSAIANTRENPLLSTLALKKFLEPQILADGNVRAFGLDVKTRYSTNMGDFFPYGTLSHSGWTGTSVVIEPKSKIIVIILSNRTLLETGDAINLRGAVANVVAGAVMGNE